MAITSPYSDRLQAAMTTLQSRTPRTGIAQPAPRPMDPTGIVPVNRTQPVAGDAGEAQRLMEQRLGSMPPTNFPNTGIVPIDRIGGMPSGVSAEAMQRIAMANDLAANAGPRAQTVMDSLTHGRNPGPVHDPRVPRDPRVQRDPRLPEEKQRGGNPEAMARQDARRQSRVSRLQEFLARRPDLAARLSGTRVGGLLGV